MLNNEEMLLDLPSIVEGGFTPAAGVGAGWVDVDYETEGFSGRGLATGARSGAGRIALNLNLHGRYTLYVALGVKSALRVWVEGEAGYREFITQHGGNGVQECELHTVELTGQRIIIETKSDNEPQPAFIAYVRAVPATSVYSGARNMVATNDGFSWAALDGIDSVRDVWRFFTPFQESDFFRMLWCPAGADVTACHRTNAGSIMPRVPTHAYFDCDRTHAQTWDQFLETGDDILAEAVAAARATGVEIQFYIRPEAFFAPFPWDGTFTSDFFQAHPELRCRDEYGDEIMRLSYGYPQVQDHMLAYFEELLAYQPDGLCFAFNRSLPMVICEQPVIEEFERLHGRPPRLPEEVEAETMIAARTNILTGFLDRVQALLTARNMSFSCIAPAAEAATRNWGIDLEALTARGIFESIMIDSGGYHAHASACHQIPLWQRLRAAGNVKLYPNGWSGDYDPTNMVSFLEDDIFGQGFNGGFFWDTENYTANPYNWHTLRHGGSAAERARMRSGERELPRIYQFKSVRGVKLGRYNPQRSY